MNIKQYTNLLVKWFSEERRHQRRSNAYWARVETYQKISYLLSAQISLLDALNILEQNDVVTEFKKGKTFSEILRNKGVYTYIVSRISQGERTGALQIACSDIANTLHKEKEINNKIVLAAIYPCILFLVTVGMIIFLVAYIFPKMTPLFTGMKVALPFTTRTVLWFSQSVIDFWWVYILSLLIVAVVSFILKEFILFNLFFIKDIYLSKKIQNYFSRVGSYIQSGIGLDEATEECANIENSKIFKGILNYICICIKQGISFSYVIEKHKIFPKEISAMISIGESTGRLDEICIKIGEEYENKISEYTKILTSAVEPVSMLFMGFAVGYIALSMITPLYSITQHVQ